MNLLVASILTGEITPADLAQKLEMPDYAHDMAAAVINLIVATHGNCPFDVGISQCSIPDSSIYTYHRVFSLRYRSGCFGQPLHWLYTDPGPKTVICTVYDFRTIEPSIYHTIPDGFVFDERLGWSIWSRETEMP